MPVPQDNIHNILENNNKWTSLHASKVQNSAPAGRSLLNRDLKSGNLSVIRRCSIEEERIDQQVKDLNEALQTNELTKTRMGVGYNGLELDERVQQARLDYINKPGSASYGSFQGGKDFRELAAKHFNTRYRDKPGLSKLNGDDVVFSVGSQGALTFAKKVITNEGDAVMSLGRYAYPMYKPNIEKAKGVHIGINSSDPFNPIPSPADIEQEIDKFLSENPNKKVVLIIQTENPFGCSPTEDWAKDVAGVMQKIWDKHGKNSLFGIGDGIYDGLAEDGKYYDVASYLNNLEAFVKIKSGAKTFGNAGGLRLGAIFTENQEFAKIFAEQQFIEFLSTNNEGQVALVKIMELETNPIEIAKVSKYFEENTALCKELGQNMSKSLQLQKGMFEQYQKMEQNGTYRKGGFYLWGDLTEAVSGLAIPPQLQKIAGSDTVNCATTFTRLLLNGHLMEGVRKSVLTTPIEDFIVNPKDLVEPSTGKFRIEGRFSTSAKRETFKDSFESIERTICKLLEYNISNHPEKVPEFAKNPQVQDHIKEVISRTKELDAKIAADPTLNALQKRMIAETEQAMNSTPWKTAPHMLVQNSAAIATNRNQAAFRGVAR